MGEPRNDACEHLLDLVNSTLPRGVKLEHNPQGTFSSEGFLVRSNSTVVLKVTKLPADPGGQRPSALKRKLPTFCAAGQTCIHSKMCDRCTAQRD